MKTALFSLIALIIVLSVYFFMPQTYFEVKEDSVIADEMNTESVETQQQQEEELLTTTAEDLERLAKEETYEKLERGRRNLDRSVSRLKVLLWNKKLPKQEAEAINKELLNAHGLLKNKKLLGAFTSLEAIQDELTKVTYSHNKTKEIIDQIKGLSKNK